MQEIIEFAAANTFLVLLFVGVIVAIIAMEVHLRIRGFEELSPMAAAALLSQGDAVALDVNGAAEFQKGHIVNARNVPHNQLDSSIKSLEKLRETPMLVYCKHGNLSTKACSRLVKEGFTGIKLLKGGLTAWQAENLPVTSKRKNKK